MDRKKKAQRRPMSRKKAGKAKPGEDVVGTLRTRRKPAGKKKVLSSLGGIAVRAKKRRGSEDDAAPKGRGKLGASKAGAKVGGSFKKATVRTQTAAGERAGSNKSVTTRKRAASGKSATSKSATAQARAASSKSAASKSATRQTRQTATGKGATAQARAASNKVPSTQARAASRKNAPTEARQPAPSKTAAPRPSAAAGQQGAIALHPSASGPRTGAGQQGALSVRAYAGDGSVMLCFNLEPQAVQGLAGFAVQCTPPSGRAYPVLNRLSFKTQYTAATTPEQRVWTSSFDAPLQKFNWLDMLQDDTAGVYTYAVTAMYFTDQGGALRRGDTAQVKITVDKLSHANLNIGFTRGYLSSQAYATRFRNAPIRPEKKSMDYDTGPYRRQYEWLGYHARKMMFDFLQECVRDPKVTVDVFAYDLDEPDVIRSFVQLKNRARFMLDNAALHTKPGAMEIQALAALRASAGTSNVQVGHFGRFAHNKVIIQKRDGKAVKVLTGSANFSVRGLYVQANNVLVFNDPTTAQLYATAFEQAFATPEGTAGFAKADIASKWFDVRQDGLPQFSVAFSPHKTAEVSLQKVADAITNAKSSVLFAVMELQGGGPVMQAIANLRKRPVFTYGMTQSESGATKVFPPNSKNGVVADFAALTKHVPAPFVAEWTGGAGQVIHHKFVVVDFNGAQPWVFTGSSNLAGGGEKENGDNLLAIQDAEVARMYAVEALRLVDHYHFRGVMQQATQVQPLTLCTDDSWTKEYYDNKNMRCLERSTLM